MKTVLFIAPYFAPQAAVGAFRSVKLARRLPAFGYRPVVLAGTFPADSRDEALLGAVPSDVEVHEEYLSPALLRARELLRRSGPSTPRRGPLTGLDPFHGLWDRYALHGLHAVASGCALARRRNAAVVLASLGPFSAAPVALEVGRRLGLPVVLDLRDPFSLHETGAHAHEEGAVVRARAALIRALEADWMRRAAHVVLNTERTAAAYHAAYPGLAKKSSVIRNCFDLDLYRAGAPKPAERFRVLHFGTLRADTPIDDIAAGFKRFVEAERLSPADAELAQIGTIGEHERGVVAALGIEAFFREEGRVAQRDALVTLRGAHLLVVANTGVIALRISAKIYDYAASGMPVLAISDNAELDALFPGRGDFTRTQPGDVAGIARRLSTAYARFQAERALPSPMEPPDALSATRAAERLAAVLDSVLRARS